MFVNVSLTGTTPIPLYISSRFTCQIIKLDGSKALECLCISANMNYMYSSKNVSLIKVLKVLVLSAYKFNKCCHLLLACILQFYHF